MSTVGDLHALREVSARIGADHLLVQGPGGNTSLKVGDSLWVKASGYWLSEALERIIFVQLPISQIRAHWAAGLDVEGSTAEGHPRASIETILHALMPHAAVIHAHPVNCVVTAILEDGRTRAAAALDGVVRWTWVDYRRPGRPLAEAVEQAVGRVESDVLLLQNHGVVVGAKTPAGAEALLRRIEGLLDLPRRELKSPPAIGALNAGCGEYERLDGVSGLGFDNELIGILGAAPLVPDQVVFVGGAVPVCAAGETVDEAGRRIEAETGIAPAVVLAPGLGAFGRRGRSRGAEAMIDALFEVASRLPAGAKVRGLTPSQVHELLGWDAEHHRQALDRANA